MSGLVKRNNIVSILIALVLFVSLVIPVSAHRRPYRHKHSKTKHIAVGTAVGAVGGALLNGTKGALIGAGAGAGTGYLVYKYKKNKHRRRR